VTPAADALVAQQMTVRQRLTDYLALTKPRVVLMVLITTFVGYYLGSREGLDPVPLLHTLVGTALAKGINLHDPRYVGHQVPASVPIAGLFDAGRVEEARQLADQEVAAGGASAFLLRKCEVLLTVYFEPDPVSPVVEWNREAIVARSESK